MKIKDFDRIAEVISIIKSKNLNPDLIRIDDYSSEIILRLEFKKENGKNN